MHAITFERFGPAEVLALRDVPPPVLRPGHVLVRVVAASVNPKDTFVRKGRFRRLSGSRFPLPSGYDAAGVVVDALGSSFVAGDHVFGMLNGWRGGAAAELVAWPANELSLAPRTVPLAEAAAVPLAALTALQALRDHLAVDRGATVLVNGATGGVGSFAIQIAKHLGARVTAVCSRARADHARALGADAVHDYAAGVLPDGRFDGVFDVFGNLGARAVRSILGSRGRYVTTVPSATNVRALLAFWRRPRTRIVNVRSRANDLRTLAAMVDAGDLRIVVDARFPAAEAAAAHRHVESKHTMGKVLLDFSSAPPIR